MGKELLSKEKLDTKVEILGHQLTEKCHEYGGGIVFVCFMNGAFMFYSDLVKHIQYPIETSFLKCQYMLCSNNGTRWGFRINR